MNLGAADSPTFIAQYGPLLAALVALTGVLITLFVAGRRSERDSKIRREDEYRSAVRAAVVSVLSAARTFYQEGGELADPRRFIHLGYEGATELRNRADQAISTLSTTLIEARLLALDRELQKALDDVVGDFEAAARVVHEGVDAFWEGRPPLPFWHERQARWQSLAGSCARLQEIASRVLAPTVRTDQRQRLREGTSRS